ncbi:MAG TPA: TetR/AcrR family transcriptional regulator, partial [Candidatus Sulfotelmatobacter sp.]|nr:TetR/AcrR family transcriptional regulator [Candidatus Sulfotelmatobacter sp.]
MADIAKEANVSPATAYRYFPTLEDLHSEYLFSVVLNLRDYSLASSLSGKRIFHDVVRAWIGVLDTYGKAMTQIRSRNG